MNTITNNSIEFKDLVYACVDRGHYAIVWKDNNGQVHVQCINKGEIVSLGDNGAIIYHI